jgi:precorrin-2 dehydrogenase/sirohydrochlorin ferrochelatase
MPRPYYTLNLDVAGKSCLVVGGDAEALEKSRRLVEAGAELTVVARRLAPDFADFLERRGVEAELRSARPEDVRGRFLVLNCVKSDPELSAWVYEAGLKERALVWAFDQPEHGNTSMVAEVKAGRLRLAVSSDGTAPALVGAVRRSLEGLFDGEFAAFSEELALRRQEALDRGEGFEARRGKFRKQLEGFRIDGRIVYPGSEAGEKPRSKDGGPEYGALIAEAASVVRPRRIGKHTSGDVGCALVDDQGRIFKGVCLDLPCGLECCAEYAAVTAMVTAGGSRITRIVSVLGDGTVLPPCGSCRELMRQIDPGNMDTEVVLGLRDSVLLRELLPHPWKP